MLRSIVHNRMMLSFGLAASVGYVLLKRWPFPAANDFLQLIQLQRPWLFEIIRWIYATMLFSTPLIVFSASFAMLYIFAVRTEPALVRNPLPPYPPPSARERLSLVIGEIHHPKQLGPAEHPQWLIVPDRGLFTGIAVFGAIGSGKTRCCLVPFAQQILSYARKKAVLATDEDKVWQEHRRC